MPSSTGIRRRPSKCSTWRSPGPSSTATSTLRTSSSKHGADINTNWSSHEPASILHELVFHGNYEAMQFLIDRGIDMTINDYRWGSTAQGWALYAAKDEKMAQWLEDAERQRAPRN